MLNHREILEFVRINMLDLKLYGVLQVGSSARGYNIKGSDIDLMAFYDNNGDWIEKSFETKFKGYNIKLEHDDLDAFIMHNSDYRFNIASLRQVLKVRDGVTLIKADNHLQSLTEFASRAHLDKSILLGTLENSINELKELNENNLQYTLHIMLKRLEFISMLEIMSEPYASAYSKPKWLYKTLEDGKNFRAINLLNDFYQPTNSRIEITVESTKALINSISLINLSKPDYNFLKTAINDFNSIAHKSPRQMFPAAFFVSGWIHKLFEHSDPLDILKKGRGFSNSHYEKIFKIPDSNFKILKDKYLTYLEEIITKSDSYYKRKIDNVKFANKILDHYCSDNLLPLNDIKSLKDSMKLLSNFKSR